MIAQQNHLRAYRRQLQNRRPLLPNPGYFRVARDPGTIARFARGPYSLWDLDSVSKLASKLSRVRDKLLERAPAGVDLEPQNGTGAEDEGHEDHLRKRWV